MKRPLRTLVLSLLTAMKLTLLLSGSHVPDVPGSGSPDFTNLTSTLEELEAPLFNTGSPSEETCGSEVLLEFERVDETPGSQTEIYRSTLSGSGYVLIVTTTNSYYLDNVAHRKTYYYKLRNVAGSDASPFSEVKTATVGSDYYKPVFSAVPVEGGVEVTLRDRTYVEEYYSIGRIGPDGSQTIMEQQVMADSGSVFTIVDDGMVQGETYTYELYAKTLTYCEKYSWPWDLEPVASIDVTIPIQLEGAVWEDGSSVDQVCGSEVPLLFSPIDTTPGVQTEVYRSTSIDDGYVRIITTAYQGSTYYLDDVAPRKTYYYKLRTVLDGQASPFSEVQIFTVGSDYYKPVFSAVSGENGVEVTLRDRTYGEEYYSIIRSNPDGSSSILMEQQVLVDSGSVFTIVDSDVIPGENYTYRALSRAIEHCDKYSWGFEETTSVDVTIPMQLEGAVWSNDPPFEEVCGSETLLQFERIDESPGVQTEIYRSTSINSGYVLIATTTNSYHMDDLAPRSTYYYKLRTVLNGQASPFSDVKTVTVGSDYHKPVFSATPVGKHYVEFTLEDRAYTEEYYSIIRIGDGAVVELMEPQVMADSGSVLMISDLEVESGQTYTYELHHKSTLHCDKYSWGLDEVISIDVTVPIELEGTAWSDEPPFEEVCGSETLLQFYIIDEYPGVQTEIYRSTSINSGYALIATTQFEGSGYYLDDLAPNTTYYYKLRTVLDGKTSPFSIVRTVTVGDDYYAPLFSAVLAENGVELTVRDRAYTEDYYSIIRIGAGDVVGIMEQQVLADSGSMFTIVDNDVIPGETYTYELHHMSELHCDKYQWGLDEVVSVDVTIPMQLEGAVWEDRSSGEETCGSEVPLLYSPIDTNPGVQTEVYRSSSINGEYALITTSTYQGYNYYLDDVAPRKTYYYKLRTVLDGQVSPFSEVQTFTVGSDYHNPVFSAVVVENGVEVTLRDRTYMEEYFAISRIGGGDAKSIMEQQVMADSGSVFTIVDTDIIPGETYTYEVYSKSLEFCDKYSWPWHLEPVASIDVTIPMQLEGAVWEDRSPGEETCGSEVPLLFSPIDTALGVQTEVYRSTSINGEYTLITSTGYTGSTYYLDDVAPRKTYYYKLRTVLDGQVSPFSEVQTFTVGSDYYTPLFSAVPVENGVEVTLRDRTYVEEYYSISRSDLDGFIMEHVLADSGSVFTIVDTDVLPGETYTYTVVSRAIEHCDKYSWGFDEVVSVDVTIPEQASGRHIFAGLEGKLALYPNPVAPGKKVTLRGVFSSKLKPVRVQMVSVNGAIVYDREISCSGCAEFDIELGSHISAGLYAVQVLQGRQRQVVKLIVK